MASLLKKIIVTNAPLKVCSLILGYAFWHMLSGMHTTTSTLCVPLCFYNDNDTVHLDAPETINITLAGKQSHLRRINTKQIAAHINAQTITSGPNPIAITQETLFLPESIKLVHYEPAPLIINAQVIKES